MTAEVVDPGDVLLGALEQRLSAAAEQLLAIQPDVHLAEDQPPGSVAAELLPRLLAACGEVAGPSHWLLMTAVAAAFPSAGDVQRLARQIGLYGPDSTALLLLDKILNTAPMGLLDRPMRVVRDHVVVDADHCAHTDRHDGIHRVVRETMRRWRRAGHPVVAVAQTPSHLAYRDLTSIEDGRVFAYAASTPGPDSRRREVDTGPDDIDRMLVVPWRTTVLWLEMPHPDGCLRLSALARYSGNTVGLVGYDMIPVLTTEMRPFGESGIHQRYLSAVKHAHRVAGISSSATTEFRGFSEMVSIQGMAPPRVAEVELAEDVGEHIASRARYTSTRPIVLVTGRREPHKNQRAVLHAAERLWAAGLDFEVTMLGGPGWDESDLEPTINRLQAEGWPLTTLGFVPDIEMWARIRDASFVVFASLHEGYGLPIAEALACGTPVVTTMYGSQGEIGAKGGCVLIDPRDDAQLLATIRNLIVHPDRLQELRAEISRRPRRTWDDYARDLWGFLVQGMTR